MVYIVVNRMHTLIAVPLSLLAVIIGCQNLAKIVHSYKRTFSTQVCMYIHTYIQSEHTRITVLKSLVENLLIP